MPEGREWKMSLSVRSFEIPSGEGRDVAETLVTEFMASVEVERVETAFDDGAWRLLVMFRDRREQEEAAQIAQVVSSALKQWRDRVAQATDVLPDDVLSDEVMASIARYVPTTTLELNVVLGAAAEPIVQYQNEIVAVVRDTLGELV